MTTNHVTELLADQIEVHWRSLLRPRLAGLTTAEYLWEPVADMWSLRPRGTSTAGIQGGSGEMVIEFAYPEPSPAPATTIAWRMGHILVGVLGARVAGHFGGPDVDYYTYDYPTTSDEALAHLDALYDAWIAGVRGLSDADLELPCGPSEGEWSDHPMAELVLHIHRELIHHGAEIALLRDLYAHTAPPATSTRGDL